MALKGGNRPVGGATKPPLFSTKKICLYQKIIFTWQIIVRLKIMLATPTLQIEVNKTKRSRLNDQDINHVPFGKIFTDHMFVAEYENGKWTTCSIEPYGSVSLSYACCALHYGQTIFEGMKAYRTVNDETVLFRPNDNFNRF